jgi:hypothetical protein
MISQAMSAARRSPSLGVPVVVFVALIKQVGLGFRGQFNAGGFEVMGSRSCGRERWPIFILFSVFAVAIAVLVAADRSPKTLLFDEAAWNNTRFIRLHPDRLSTDLSDGLIALKTPVFLNFERSNPPPGWGTFVGHLESPEFKAPANMVIPIQGLTYTIGQHQARLFDPQGATIVLRCIATHRTVQLLTTPSHVPFELPVSLPADWCSGKVKLELNVFKPYVIAGVGTPVAVSAIYALAAGGLKFFLAFGVASVFFFLLFVPILLVTRLPYLLRGGLSLLSVGIYGYASYAVQAVNVAPALIVAINAVLLVLPMTVFAIAAAQGLVSGATGLLSRICLGWLVLYGAIVGVFLILPVDAGAWTVNFAFYPVAWSTDNQLPVTMARYVLETDKVQPPGIGAWSITDRGFPPAGLVAGLLFSLDKMGLLGENPVTYLLAQMMIATVNASILLLVILLPVFSNTKFRSVAKMSLALCCTPFFFFNVVYDWPKIAAGSFALWSILILTSAIQYRRFDLLWLVAPLLTFGALFHPAIMFLVPVVFCYSAIAGLYLARRRDTPLDMATAMTIVLSIAVSVLVMWYHDSFGERSSFGASYVLTGNGSFGLSRQQVMAAVYDFYGKIEFHSLLKLKWSQIATFAWPVGDYADAYLYENGVLPTFRFASFFAILPALSLFTLAILPHAGRLALYGTVDALVARPLWSAMAICAAGYLALLVVAACPLIVHVLPYTLLITPLVLAVVSADYASRGVTLLLAAHITLFVFVWVVDPWSYWTYRHFSP